MLREGMLFIFNGPESELVGRVPHIPLTGSLWRTKGNLDWELSWDIMSWGASGWRKQNKTKTLGVDHFTIWDDKKKRWLSFIRWGDTHTPPDELPWISFACINKCKNIPRRRRRRRRRRRIHLSTCNCKWVLSMESWSWKPSSLPLFPFWELFTIRWRETSSYWRRKYEEIQRCRRECITLTCGVSYELLLEWRWREREEEVRLGPVLGQDQGMCDEETSLFEWDPQSSALDWPVSF